MLQCATIIFSSWSTASTLTTALDIRGFQTRNSLQSIHARVQAENEANKHIALAELWPFIGHTLAIAGLSSISFQLSTFCGPPWSIRKTPYHKSCGISGQQIKSVNVTCPVDVSFLGSMSWPAIGNSWPDTFVDNNYSQRCRALSIGNVRKCSYMHFKPKAIISPQAILKLNLCSFRREEDSSLKIGSWQWSIAPCCTDLYKCTRPKAKKT